MGHAGTVGFRNTQQHLADKFPQHTTANAFRAQPVPELRRPLDHGTA